MLFTPKKVIGGMLLPLPLMLLMIGVGPALVWFSRFQKTGKVFISVGWLALTLLSLQPVSDHLVTNRKPLPYPAGSAKGGIYCGSPAAAIPEPAVGAEPNFTNNSLPRLAEGIRLWRANPGAKLILPAA